MPIDPQGLAEFLRQRRESLQPDDVGLPRGQRRRRWHRLAAVEQPFTVDAELNSGCGAATVPEAGPGGDSAAGQPLQCAARSREKPDMTAWSLEQARRAVDYIVSKR